MKTSFHLINKITPLKALKVFIVEDEPLIAATINTALKKQGFKVLGDTDEYEDALRKIDTLIPDLVLVDIQLEGNKDGVDLALELDKRKQPYLYLTSQTDPNTIVRVKETKPLGFIVKPFTEAGLRSNIELAWHNFNLTEDEFLLIKSEGRVHKLNQASITHLKAFDNYCYVYTQSSNYLVPHTLKYVFEKLNPKFFIKSHRSYVVNLRKVLSLNTHEINLATTSIPLSKGQKELVKKKLLEL